MDLEIPIHDFRFSALSNASGQVVSSQEAARVGTATLDRRSERERQVRSLSFEDGLHDRFRGSLTIVSSRGREMRGGDRLQLHYCVFLLVITKPRTNFRFRAAMRTQVMATSLYHFRSDQRLVFRSEVRGHRYSTRKFSVAAMANVVRFGTARVEGYLLWLCVWVACHRLCWQRAILTTSSFTHDGDGLPLSRTWRERNRLKCRTACRHHANDL